jgi:amino-acid N-acetyltransferase
LEARVIRIARPEDRPGVEELLATAGLPVEGVAEHFHSFFVADQGGLIVGAAGLECRGKYALLRSVVVATDTRRTGIGTTLTRRTLEEALARDVTSVYLLTTTAEAFFRRFGFERVPRDSAPAQVRQSVEFRGACPDSAIAMALHTRPASGPLQQSG